MKSKNKKRKNRTKDQKKFLWIAGIISLINIILFASFLIYLYFWIKSRS